MQQRQPVRGIHLADWERSFIAEQRVARLATTDVAGQPHAVPIVYAFDGERLFTPLDAKPKRVPLKQLRRVRNIEAHPRVAVIIDEYDEDWHNLVWVQLRGWATLAQTGPEHGIGTQLLTAKYPQYAVMPLESCPLIVVWVDQIASWRAAGP